MDSCWDAKVMHTAQSECSRVGRNMPAKAKHTPQLGHTAWGEVAQVKGNGKSWQTNSEIRELSSHQFINYLASHGSKLKLHPKGTWQRGVWYD